MVKLVVGPTLTRPKGARSPVPNTPFASRRGRYKPVPYGSVFRARPRPDGTPRI